MGAVSPLESVGNIITNENVATQNALESGSSRDRDATPRRGQLTNGFTWTTEQIKPRGTGRKANRTKKEIRERRGHRG